MSICQSTWNCPIKSRFLSPNISQEQSSLNPSWLRSRRSDWKNLSWTGEQALKSITSFLKSQNLHVRVKHVLGTVIRVV